MHEDCEVVAYHAGPAYQTSFASIHRDGGGRDHHDQLTGLFTEPGEPAPPLTIMIGSVPQHAVLAYANWHAGNAAWRQPGLA